MSATKPARRHALLVEKNLGAVLFDFVVHAIAHSDGRRIEGLRYVDTTRSVTFRTMDVSVFPLLRSDVPAALMPNMAAVCDLGYRRRSHAEL